MRARFFLLHALTKRRLQCILISRFLSNLRKAAQPADSTEMERFSRFSIRNFHAPTIPGVIGNMDQPLENGFGDDIRAEEIAAGSEIYLSQAASVAGSSTSQEVCLVYPPTLVFRDNTLITTE